MKSRTTNCEHWCKFEKEEFVVFFLFVSYFLLRRNKIPIPPSTHVTYTHKQFFILFIQFSTFFISSSFDLLTSQFTYRTKRKKKLWWKHQQNVRKRTNTAKAYKLFTLIFFYFSFWKGRTLELSAEWNLYSGTIHIFCDCSSPWLRFRFLFGWWVFVKCKI